MLFKDLKVGDTIFVKNPKQWEKPIKKTIGNIVPDGIWLRFYTADGELIGEAIAKRSQGFGSGIFADFDTFKKYWENYHMKNIKHLQHEMQTVAKALGSAVDDLATAGLMVDKE